MRAKYLEDYLLEISERDQLIFDAKVYSHRSFRDIGEQWHISAERAHQIFRKTIWKLWRTPNRMADGLVIEAMTTEARKCVARYAKARDGRSITISRMARDYLESLEA